MYFKLVPHSYRYFFSQMVILQINKPFIILNIIIYCDYLPVLGAARILPLYSLHIVIGDRETELSVGNPY